MKLKIYAIVITAILLWVACGGSSHLAPASGTSSPTQHSVIGSDTMPGPTAIRVTEKTTVARDWSLIPKVYAQAVQPYVASSYVKAMCAASPANLIETTELITFGGGRLDSPAGCANMTSQYGIQPGRASIALVNFDGGPIWDSGTAFKLAVHVSSKSVLSGADGAPPYVYLRRDASMMARSLATSCSFSRTMKFL